MSNYTDHTVDPNEVAFYEQLAARWWDDRGPFWPLHRLNTLRVNYIREQACAFFGRPANAAAPLKGLRVLDIGCGGGILSEAMAGFGADVTGVDVVERNIQVARLHAHCAGLDIDYRVGGAQQLAATGEKFDLVLNMEVVEHVADLPGFVAACCRLTDPAGLMFIATINRTWLSWLVAIVGAEYILRWLPRGTHQWRRFPRPHELEGLMHDQGLAVFQRSGVQVNPFTRNMRLSRFMGVNYMLTARRNSGMIGLV